MSPVLSNWSPSVLPLCNLVSKLAVPALRYVCAVLRSCHFRILVPLRVDGNLSGFCVTRPPSLGLGGCAAYAVNILPTFIQPTDRGHVHIYIYPYGCMSYDRK